MSKVDDVFDFADELIDEWGQQVQLVIKGDPSYDINTGETRRLSSGKGRVNNFVQSGDAIE